MGQTETGHDKKKTPRHFSTTMAKDVQPESNIDQYQINSNGAPFSTITILKSFMSCSCHGNQGKTGNNYKYMVTKYKNIILIWIHFL